MASIVFTDVDERLISRALEIFDPEQALSGLVARDKLLASDWQFVLRETRNVLRCEIYEELITVALMAIEIEGIALDTADGRGVLREALGELLHPQETPDEAVQGSRIANELHDIEDFNSPLKTNSGLRLVVDGVPMEMYENLENQLMDAQAALYETARKWVRSQARRPVSP